jgi:SAM-dependent methyltransferase
LSICTLPQAQLKRDVVSALQSQLSDFYSKLSGPYYTISDRAAQQYTTSVQPFHCDFVSRVKSGATVLELGCGTAHLCSFVEKAGASYVGLDHSEALLQKNRERFPGARFFPVGTALSEVFDVVASLYTIEHVVDPAGYLESMWKFCKPGGLIAVICPDFVDGEGLPPSFFYGKTSKRIREKLAALAFADVGQHLLDLLWFAPRWKSLARSTAPGAFWINLRPRILHGAPYSIDADAVHLPRLDDLVFWLQERGAEIVATSRSLPNVNPTVLRHNCYVVARKAVAGPSRLNQT